jgi:hypothetical protein
MPADVLIVVIGHFKVRNNYTFQRKKLDDVFVE